MKKPPDFGSETRGERRFVDPPEEEIQDVEERRQKLLKIINNPDASEEDKRKAQATLRAIDVVRQRPEF